MKVLVAFILLAIFTPVIDLERRSLLDGKIEMLIPKEFRWLTDEERKIKYANSAAAPKWILTNEELNVNLAFTHTATHVDDVTLPLIQEKIAEQMTSAYPNAEWKGKGMTTINGKSFGFIKLIAERADKTFNYMVMTELDDKLLILSFNCSERLMKEWEPVAEKMMTSVIVPD